MNIKIFYIDISAIQNRIRDLYMFSEKGFDLTSHNYSSNYSLCSIVYVRLNACLAVSKNQLSME